jgi:glycerophosphoryl diester phosphodiesterase
MILAFCEKGVNMPPIVVILLVILALVAIFLAIIFPGKRKDMDEYISVKYAHRGLHNEERAENSLSAFKAAVDAGFGIEMDVRLSKDRKLVVFHDDTLDRVCGVSGKVVDFTADELAKLSLNGTGEGVPTLKEVLAVVDGKVPLIIEVKEDSGDAAVSAAVEKELFPYKGAFVLESFNPLTVARVSQSFPEVCSGFLSRHFTKDPEHKGNILYFALQHLLFNRICNPSFIAYHHEHYYMPVLRLVRLLGARTVAWTVRSKEEELAAYEHGFDTIIFENYIPAQMGK